MLFFFEGPNPSVQETLRAVLREFTPDEAVAASPFGKRLDLEGEHDQIALEPFLPERVADSLVGVEQADGMFGGTDRVLTASADGIVEALNHPMVRAEDLKCARKQQGVAKVIWHGMPPN